MNKLDSKIFIIDDDPEIRNALSLLLKSKGYSAETFNGVEDLFKRDDYSGPGCILLDLFLEEKSSIDLQAEIESKFDCLPVIFITGFGNISISVEALKKGAINFLEKPIDENRLIIAIEEALTKSFTLVERLNEIEKLKSLISTLTAREYEIFRYVITGLLNKQIAAELEIAEHTVKNHRLRITEKLGVKSVAEFIYMAEKLNIKGAVVNQ